MNERISAIRARAFRSKRGADDESAKFREESFAQTEGESDVIREAKAIAHYSRNRALLIQDGELLVGSPYNLEHNTNKDSVPRIFGRQGFKSPWPVPSDVGMLFESGVLSGAGNHTTMDYQMVVNTGFEGLLGKIAKRRSRLSVDEPDYNGRTEFLDALEIVARGYIDFCERYGEHARELSRTQTDPDRARELEKIADNCAKTPRRPPTSFWEACQALWSCFFFLPDAPGRVDQYLNPYYEKDLASGAITPDSAEELLSCLWIKYFEFAGAEAGVSAFHHLTLGGINPDGTDACNAVTKLCLEVTDELMLNRPQIGLRWNRNTPPEILQLAVSVLKTNSGSPDFCNDEQIVPALVNIGIAVEDARDFSLSGCHEVIVTGKAQMGSVEGFINLPKTLLIALGLEPSLAPGADLNKIDSYDALWEALEESMEFVAEGAHRASIERDQQAADMAGGNLAASLVVNDCIENVTGYTQGGARYNHCNWDVIGIANLADALGAMRTLVFETKELTVTEFAKMCQSNWEGSETVRQRVLNHLPHFGNNDDNADLIAAKIIEVFSGVMKKLTPFRGGEYCLGTTAGGENMHMEFGRLTGATPDGRQDGSPLADSLGAIQGRDRHGVTALLNSVAKLPHGLLPTATTLNVKMDPVILSGEGGVERVAALIEGHFMAGGQQCQFNLVSRKTLLDAKENPEEYGDLMVRVAGYSAPFTSLWEDLQDEIIARTEHER